MNNQISHVSNILYLFDQLKDHPYGSRAIVVDHVCRLGRCRLDENVSGSELVLTLMEFSEENLLDVIRVARAVYAIPTNRKEAAADLDSDSDSIEKFG